MPSSIFNTILDEKINHFKNIFCNQAKKIFVDPSTGKTIHPGEFGMYREQICRSFLKLFTPESFSIDSGFVMMENDELSNQADIIIYDPRWTSVIENDGSQKFFPIETVIAVGEVKSILRKKELFNALKKLSKLKEYRNHISLPNIVSNSHDPISSREFDPLKYSYDQIVTFLICDRFDFNIKNLPLELANFYDSENIDYPLRHNAILSLTDGLWVYYDKTGLVARFHPFSANTYLKNRVYIPKKDSNSHIRLFCNGFCVSVSSVVTLFPEMGNYMGTIEKLEFIDEEDLVNLEDEKFEQSINKNKSKARAFLLPDK